MIILHQPVIPEIRDRKITECAFKDRLGWALVTAIAASKHPVCLGLREFLSNRDYVFLDRPDLPALLGKMVELGLPESIPGIYAGPLTTEKAEQVINDPVLEEERPGV